jgi:peroxiredoxin
VLALSCFVFAGCSTSRDSVDTSQSPPESAPSHIKGYTDDGVSVPVTPGPAVGQRLAEVNLTDRDGNNVTLASLYRLGPIVVTFYRGGWCPYCTGALKEWEGRVGELEAMGVRFVAITPERPELVRETSAATGAHFEIYSDHAYEAADRFRLRFSVDPETREQYRGYGIDVGAANAKGTWDLPAPGTFIVDVNGVVRYAWADWDYTKRADPDEVIAAAREVVRMGPTRTR